MFFKNSMNNFCFVEVNLRSVLNGPLHRICLICWEYWETTSSVYLIATVICSECIRFKQELFLNYTDHLFLLILKLVLAFIVFVTNMLRKGLCKWHAVSTSIFFYLVRLRLLIKILYNKFKSMNIIFIKVCVTFLTWIIKFQHLLWRILQCSFIISKRFFPKLLAYCMSHSKVSQYKFLKWRTV